MPRYIANMIKIISALIFLMLGLLALLVMGVKLFAEDIDEYLSKKSDQILPQSEKAQRPERWSADCEIMEPIVVKYDRVTITYPSSAAFRESTTTNRPILRRKPESEGEKSSMCRPEAGYIVPLSLTVYGSLFSTDTDRRPLLPEAVSYIKISPRFFSLRYPYNRLDLTGTDIDGGRCDKAHRLEHRRCHLVKEIEDTGIYITIVIRPASPEGGLKDKLYIYGKDDWPDIVDRVEQSLAPYISVN